MSRPSLPDLSGAPEDYRGLAAGALPAVLDALVATESATIVAHRRPDADAIGSAVALGEGLRRRGVAVRVVIGQDERFAENLYTIPGAADIELTSRLPEAGCYVTVDCGSLERTGSLAADVERVASEAKAGGAPVVCLDHHSSNPGFGSVNFVAPDAESTTILVYDVLRGLSVDLDYRLAHALYAGLMTDTGSFKWGGERMHLIAAELMGFGLDVRRIAAELIDTSSITDLQMLGRVLAEATMLSIDGVSVAVLVADHQTVLGHSSAVVEKLADFVHSIEAADMGVVFKATGRDSWAVSLRSPELDVSELATRLGGGGHRRSAGYNTSGGREAVVDEFAVALRATVAPQRRR
ncbi:DHH family phosphoesterase [Corynebacterium otitidis]|uniref:Uncharacterized protein n=1 Tax=Corynebacterium otitidis ATCC 51513 TaxID=883169 RepID=K0YIJ2_9CORY|nr:DHH family phosphoesterase [Corynebacterium otitidis]EJZ82988.1 hypothetical protein HMPREF9719_00099 [Corynebacterium otitidis ATCC 51513]